MFLEENQSASTVKLGYEFSDDEFTLFQALIREKTGIHVESSKRNLLYGRLSRRLRALDLGSFSEYYNVLKYDVGDEMQEFTNVVTTNLTSFFRQPLQFDYLRELFDDFKENRIKRSIRIWSVGSSTGEEAYSIAAVAHEVFGSSNQWVIKILGVDIDSNVLDIARQGIYSGERINDVPLEYRKKSFLKGSGNHAGLVKVSQPLLDMVEFKQLNLMGRWPVRGPFDIIFCRNTIIYFEKEDQAALFPRFAEMQDSGDHLFIGFSENLIGVNDEYALLQNSIYKKK